MEKKIVPKNVLFGEFDRQASELYMIPSLQRPYTWGYKQVEKLWDDLLENPSPYYIGSIVGIAGNGSLSRDEIIDGQQRLVTLSLMLIALREQILDKKEFSFEEEDILSILIRSGRKIEDTNRLVFRNRNSDNFFKALIEGKVWTGEKTDTQKKFHTNLDFLRKKVKHYIGDCEPEKVKELLSKIKSLQIIYIECSDRSSAYKLFESINATSVSLASTDMIKNAIFATLHESEEGLEDVEQKWENMFNLFDENSALFKTFIRHHWISTKGYVSHAQLFDKFLQEYNDKGEVKKYLKSLNSSAEVYVALREASIEELKFSSVRKRFDRQEVKEVLEFLSYLRVDQVYAVLLAYYNSKGDGFKKVLNRLAAFQFLYKYVPGSPSVPEKKFFADFCIGIITKEEMFEGLFKLCKGFEEEFVEAFLQKVKYRKGGKNGDIQFVLEKYLYSMEGPNKFREPTIEHIISQSSKKDFVHQLGNLTILEEIENSKKYSNKKYSEKKKFYPKDKYEGNRLITVYSFDKKPEEAISKRGDDIARSVYKMFLGVVETGKWPIGE